MGEVIGFELEDISGGGSDVILINGVIYVLSSLFSIFCFEVFIIGMVGSVVIVVLGLDNGIQMENVVFYYYFNSSSNWSVGVGIYIVIVIVYS